MNILAGIALLFSIFAMGWLLLSLLNFEPVLEKIGLSFLIGSFLFTVEMMMVYQVTDFFSATYNWLILSFNLFLLFILNLLFAKNWHFPKITEKAVIEISHDWQKVLLIFIIGFLLYSLLSNLTWPVNVWDAIALYDFRAIVINYSHSWVEGKELGYFYHYPPFTSLLHSALYLVQFNRIKIIYTLLFSSYLIVYFSYLKRKLDQNKALIGTFFLTIAPLIYGHVTIAYTNLPFTIFYTLALFYSIDFFLRGDIAKLFLSTLMLSASIWVRQSEPVWVMVLIIQAISFYKHQFKMKYFVFLINLVLFGIFYEYWPLYVKSLNLPLPPSSTNDAVGYNIPINLGTITHHFFLVTDFILKNAFRPIKYLIAPLVILIIFDSKTLRQKNSFIYLICLLLLFGVIFAGTYYFSFTYKSWNLIGESVTRLVMFLVPLIILIIMHSHYWDFLEEKNKKKSRK